MISETHLTSPSSPAICNYTGYFQYRPLRPGGKVSGGTALYVRKGIPHHRLNVPAFTKLEATVIKITIPNLVPIALASVYISPVNRTIFPSSELEALLGLCSNMIIAGDLNSRHLDWDTATNQYGAALKRLAQCAKLRIVAPPTPTHYKAGSNPTVIDLALFRNIPFDYTISADCNLTSDHLPVLLTLNFDKISLDHPAELHTNWDNFRYTLEYSSKPPSLKITSADDVDKCVQEMNHVLLEAVAAASKPNHSKPNHHTLPGEIRDKIKQRNRLRKDWQRTRYPIYGAQFRKLHNEIKAMIKTHTQQRWRTHLENLTPSDHSLWRTTKNLRIKKTTIPPINGLNGLAQTNEEKANAFADSLELQFTPHTYQNFSHLCTTTEDELTRTNNIALNTSTPNDIQDTTLAEVLDIIRGIKVRKSPGLDRISNRIIKNLPITYVCWLTVLINRMLKYRSFPQSWKTAVIIPLAKKNQNLSIAESYRPISLLSSLSKIYELVLLRRLDSFCRLNNVLIPDQHGFRSAHSTQSQLLRVVETIHKNSSNRQYTSIVFFDIAKAFDKTFIPGLISKLVRLGISAQLLTIINSYLTNRSFRVRVDQSLSSIRPIRAGVPQGGNLSPLLFNIFINDLPKIPQVKLAVFADDTALIARSCSPNNAINTLQSYITNSLERWLVTWSIKINASKSAVIIFKPNYRELSHNFNLLIFNEPIPFCHSAKYLGVTLDAHMLFSEHIVDKLKTVNKTFNALYPLLGRNSHLSTHNKLIVYNQVIAPAFLYACQVWGSAANSHIEKLQVFQNKALRCIVNAPRYVQNEVIHHDLKVSCVKERIRKFTRNFYKKNSSKPCMRDADQSYDIASRTYLGKKRPRNLLDEPVRVTWKKPRYASPQPGVT